MTSFGAAAAWAGGADLAGGLTAVALGFAVVFVSVDLLVTRFSIFGADALTLRAGGLAAGRAGGLRTGSLRGGSLRAGAASFFATAALAAFAGLAAPVLPCLVEDAAEPFMRDNLVSWAERKSGRPEVPARPE